MLVAGALRINKKAEIEGGRRWSGLVLDMEDQGTRYCGRAVFV